MSVFEIKTKEDFEKLLNTYKNVIVDHWGSWCGPCKYLAPEFEKMAQQYSSNDTVFAKCDADTKLFALEALPTIDFYVLKNKQKTIQGADVDQIRATIQDIISPPVQQPQAPQNAHSTGGFKPTSRKGGYKSYGSM